MTIEVPLRKDSDSRAIDARGWTVWHYATALSNLGLIKSLAVHDSDHTASVLRRAIDGATPLHAFGQIRHVSSSVASNRYTRGHFEASESGEYFRSQRLPAFNFLFSLVDDCGIQKNDGSTTLHEWVSSRYLNPEITKILLDNGIRPGVCRKDGKTPLHLLLARKDFTSLKNLNENLSL